MSFGRNPHVAKAEAAEQKAREARDDLASEQAWREAARQWERAAAREASEKLKREYGEKAEAARENADKGTRAGGSDEDTVPVVNTRRTTLLN